MRQEYQKLHKVEPLNDCMTAGIMLVSTGSQGHIQVEYGVGVCYIYCYERITQIHT